MVFPSPVASNLAEQLRTVPYQARFALSTMAQGHSSLMWWLRQMMQRRIMLPCSLCQYRRGRPSRARDALRPTTLSMRDATAATPLRLDMSVFSGTNA
jgi:hypothetical protein